MSTKKYLLLGLLFSLFTNEVFAARLLSWHALSRDQGGGYKCYIQYNNGSKKWISGGRNYIMNNNIARHNCDNEIWMLSAMGL